MYNEWFEDEMYEMNEAAFRAERFADPGGDSALYPATEDNPRNLPCGNCGWPNRLTPQDVAKGYQCDACAEASENGRDIDYYTDDEEEELEFEDGA